MYSVLRTRFSVPPKPAAIRDGDWKLVTSDDRDPAAWELYNLANDRSETEEVGARNLEIANRLRATWNRWATEVHALPFPERRADGAKPVPWPPK